MDARLQSGCVQWALGNIRNGMLFIFAMAMLVLRGCHTVSVQALWWKTAADKLKTVPLRQAASIHAADCAPKWLWWAWLSYTQEQFG